jgi:calcium-dependent protein kinase
LGRGASGVCFKAVLKDDNSVIRCIKKVGKVKKGDKCPLPIEAILLDQLSHPNIIRLYDVYEDDNSYYLVIE